MSKTTRALISLVAVHAIAACVDEPTSEPAPEPGSEGGAAPIEGIRAVPLADLTVPTADGRATYRIKFFETDGVIATSVTVPFGQPVPISDDCALTTFLRVADEDALVPQPLLEACGAATASFAPRRVRDLAPTLRGLEVGEAAVATCSHSTFDDHVDAMEADAAFVAQHWTCTHGIGWEGNLCKQYNAAGDAYADCTANQAQAAYSTGLWSGFDCIDEGYAPNPACVHTSTAIADWGPWAVWTRPSPFATTKVRLETSVCNEHALTRWKQKFSSGDAWGPSFYDDIPTGLNVLTLSAGWNASEQWRTRYFSLLVSNLDLSTVHIATAWSNLGGKSRFTCPSHL